MLLIATASSSVITHLANFCHFTVYSNVFTTIQFHFTAPRFKNESIKSVFIPVWSKKIKRLVKNCVRYMVIYCTSLKLLSEFPEKKLDKMGF